MVKLVRTAAALRRDLAKLKRPLGFVPTMGALHPGHLSLVRRARRECASVAVSIFVNPTQFAPGEDFRRYPRTLQADLALLSQAGSLVVFAPEARELYPEGAETWVEVGGDLPELWEGKARPGHYRGVATVVAKLFGLVQPERAYFGLKDYQQFKVVQGLVEGLRLPIHLVGCPTLREADGLAMSSRNRYLGPEERRQAPLVFESLKAAGRAAAQGAGRPALVRKAGLSVLSRGSFKVDYFAVADPDTLRPLGRIPEKGKVWLAVAARLGKTRLIDNLVVKT
jgi:pantoate--beta-alanine ligase